MSDLTYFILAVIFNYFPAILLLIACGVVVRWAASP